MIFGDFCLVQCSRRHRLRPPAALADDQSPGERIGPNSSAPRRPIDMPAPVAALDQNDGGFDQTTQFIAATAW